MKFKLNNVKLWQQDAGAADVEVKSLVWDSDNGVLTLGVSIRYNGIDISRTEIFRTNDFSQPHIRKLLTKRYAGTN